MTVQPGKFDKLITIQRRDAPVDGDAGDVQFDYSDYQTNIWTNIRPLSASRVLTFQNVQYQRASEFRIYANWNIDTTDRIVYNGYTWTIHSVISEDEQDWLKVMLAYTDESLKIE